MKILDAFEDVSENVMNIEEGEERERIENKIIELRSEYIEVLGNKILEKQIYVDIMRIKSRVDSVLKK